MKKTWLIIALSLCVAAADAQDFVQNVYGRKTTTLAGRWQVLLDQFSRGARMGVYENRTPADKSTFYEYLFSDGSRLNVPGDFNSQRPELWYYESTVWYKRDFTHDLKPGKRLFLYFGAVNYRCTVYLNGEKLGSHEGGFTPFQFEITDRLRQGNNFLIVEVNNARSPQAIPAMIYDWWNYGGITRDVLLVETPETYIDDYFIRLDRRSPDRILADVALKGVRGPETVTLSIPEAGIERKIALSADGSARGVAVPAKKLVRWSPENPKLYEVILASARDTVRERIGFRTVEVRGTEILLNGKPVFLKGINCHEEIPTGGGRRAYTDADAAFLVDEVLALGCNYLRLTHYPVGENMVRLAERKGLMMFEEIPQWQDIDYGNEATNRLARNMMGEMIRRDKNRCAIIAWSVANESRVYPERNEALIGLVAHTRGLDDTRIVTAVSDKIPYDTLTSTFYDADPLIPYLDVVCVNRYLGWYQKWLTEPRNVKWNVAPDKPFVMTEFGGEALYGNDGPDDVASSWSEPYQAKLYRDHFEMFAGIPNLRGIAPWVLYDFRSPYRMNGQYQEEWNRKGLVSENGFRKKAWYVVHDYYTKDRK